MEFGKRKDDVVCFYFHGAANLSNQVREKGLCTFSKEWDLEFIKH